MGQRTSNFAPAQFSGNRHDTCNVGLGLRLLGMASPPSLVSPNLIRGPSPGRSVHRTVRAMDSRVRANDQARLDAATANYGFGEFWVREKHVTSITFRSFLRVLRGSKIHGDSLDLPITIARWIKMVRPGIIAFGCRRGFRHGRAFGKIGWGFYMGWALGHIGESLKRGGSHIILVATGE